jgi:sulfotransferase family protein
MREQRLAWIFGSSRSGSTWLLKMLSDLQGVVSIDDPHLGHHLGVWRPIPLAWAACEDPPELSTLLELKAEEPGSHVAPLLAELFPRSKVIWLLRDGRDVVDSWLDAYSEGSWAIPGGAFPVSPEGRIPLIRWLSEVWAFRSREVRKAYEARAPEDRTLIRYEHLRDETEACVRRICGMIGVDPARVPEAVAAHRFEKVPRTARGRRQAVRRARPGGWRENLSPAEQRAMHEALGEALVELGYEPGAQLAATG